MKEPLNLVSVIIPTKNSSRKIEKCLLSVLSQSYDKIEVLVIDALSSDNTCELVGKYGVRTFSLNSERAEAKNFGILNSNGKYLLFIDSDMILEKEVVQQCVNLCSNDDKIVGVIIPERTVGSGFWVKVRDFERSLYAGSHMESARFFVKRFVNLVGGFDEQIIEYEEATLPQKLNDKDLVTNVRISSKILHDENGFSLIKWLQKKRYYSTSTKLYSQKYREYARRQRSPRSRLCIFIANDNWKMLIKHPILTVGMMTLKTLEFFSSFRI